MRKSVTLVSAASRLVAAAAPAPARAQAADDPSRLAGGPGAIAAAKSHAGTTEFGAGQALQAVEHHRRRRRHQPRAAAPHLPRASTVVGGDLVVHQSEGRRLEGQQPDPDQTLDLARRPRGLQARQPAPRRSLRSAATDGITEAKVDGSTLVVDATGASPRLAWKVMSGGSADRRHPQPAGHASSTRRPARSSAPSRRSSTSTAPARPSTAAPSRCRSPSRARRTSSRTRPAAAPTRPT